LSQLCRMYWRPIFGYVCRRGYSDTDAQDLTQDFFLSVFERKVVVAADPSRGRFRALLLTALQNFLRDARAKEGSRKRGGKIVFIGLEDWMAEAPSRLSLSREAVSRWPAEKLFDLRWAAAVTEEALRRLSEECESRGQRNVFQTLSRCLTLSREEISYARLAAALRISESLVKRLLHDLRARYRALLREEVARTVESSAEIDDEIRYLCATLAAA
jgi:DNA-directed RNA polymerase specialized sigma24 family protein